MVMTREEKNAARLAYYYRTKDRDISKRAAYYAINREQKKEKSLAWYRKNKERANATRNTYRRTPEYKARRNARLKAIRAAGGSILQRKYKQLPKSEYKILILAHYGKLCVCCGETCAKLLTVDHIADNGKDHKGIGKHRYKGEQLYKHLIKLNYPNGIQIYCFNCNIGKRNNGGTCPHKS